MKQLVVEHVSKTLGKTKVLRDIHLTVGQGMFGLLGPNGAGKTTLMRTIATLLIPEEGSIRYNGWNWNEDADQVRQVLGYLPQQFGVFQNITAMECMRYIGALKGQHDKRKRDREIENLLEKVNLWSERNKKVGKFSGGMKRRLGIAQALLGDPHILLIDEPTAGLDPSERIRFRNLLRIISVDRIVLLSTHIVEDISATCQALAVINQGKVTTFPSLQEFAGLASGQVWKWSIPAKQSKQLNISGEIISSNVTVDAVELRILSQERPHPDAKKESPTIEEGYLVWNKKQE